MKVYTRGSGHSDEVVLSLNSFYGHSRKSRRCRILRNKRALVKFGNQPIKFAEIKHDLAHARASRDRPRARNDRVDLVNRKPKLLPNRVHRATA